MIRTGVSVVFVSGILSGTLAGTLLVAGCASSSAGIDRRFPLAPHVTRDQDLSSFAFPCKPDPTKKDPHHVACAPETYVSPLAWDAVDNAIARPLSDTFRLPPTIEAINATATDEVAESAWFQNRLNSRRYTPEEIARGACEEEQMLDGEKAKEAEWIIDAGKGNGSSPGFRVNIPGKGKYMFKSDDAQGERPTASSVIGAALYNAAGFYTSCEQIVYFDPKVLKLTDGLETKDNSGIAKKFDRPALDKILERASKRGNLVRMQASAWLPGRLIGPFRYEGTRKDDPNDVIPHEDRRELRGGRVLAAWTEHHDAREQNSMDAWMADAGKKSPDSSPGYVRHYYLDTSDCLGSEWAWEPVSRRLGYSYLLDVPDISLDFISFGAVTRTWDINGRKPGFKQFGFIDVENFVPDEWKNEYQNPAFSRMTERDAAWMTRILARLDPDMVAAIMRAGKWTDVKDFAYITRVMQARLDKVFKRYLTRLSPLGEVKVEGDSVCAVDFARLRGVALPASYQYTAGLEGESSAQVGLGIHDEGLVCAKVPHKTGLTDAMRDDAKERYVVLAIRNGVAKGPLNVHLYDLGERGFYLAGIDRTID